MNRIFFVVFSIVLASCGGGKSDTPATNPATVPTTPIGVDLGEKYIDSLGGPITLSFKPDQLPSWISFKNDQYVVDQADCATRLADISSVSYKLKLIQTSKIQCTKSDVDFISNWDFISKAYLWWKEQTGELFLEPEATWPQKRGKGQIKFQVKYGDCLGTDCSRSDGARDRAEIGLTYERKDANDLASWYPDQDKEYWLNFSFYVPKPYQEQGNQAETSQTLTIWQIMTTYIDPANSQRVWLPMVQLAKEYNGNVVARTWSTSSPYHVYKLIDDENFEGHWHDVLVRYKASETSGILQIFVNGILKADFKERTVQNKNTAIYYKFGLYRPAHPNNPVQSIYFDEVRIANSRKEVEYLE